MDGVDLRWLSAATGSASSAWRHREPRPQWEYWLDALRSGPALMAGAGLAILFLLLAFHGVVAHAVSEGEMRRRAVAEILDSEWRCKSLAARAARRACLDQLTAAPSDATPVPNNIVSQGVVQVTRR